MKIRTRGRMLVAVGTSAAVIAVTAGIADAASAAQKPDGPHSSAGKGNAAGKAAKGGAAAQALREVLQQLRAGEVRGQIVVHTKKRSQTVDFQRGTVENASSRGFDVHDASGTTQSWAVSSATKVRERKRAAPKSGNQASSAQIVNGENVVVVGLDQSGQPAARVVVVLPTKPPKSRKSPAPTAPTTPTAPAAAALATDQSIV